MATVAIDPGHGGKDPGATGHGLREKDITLALGRRVAEILKGEGIKPILTRSDDRYVELSTPRVPPCDISVSIHVNAGGGRGLEAWVGLYNQPEKSRRLGQAIQDSVLKQIPFADRGLKSRKNSAGNADYLYMLRAAKGVPALVEVGFIDNPGDAVVLKSSDNLDKIALGIANGILKYLGRGQVEMKDEPSPWAKNAWDWAVGEGLFDGKNPKEPVTREQLAAVLERMIRT